MSARAVRVAITAAFSLSLGAASGALAAPPKPACNLVQDVKGDGTANILLDEGTPNDPAWDIISADIASDGSKLTTVVRVDKLAKSASSSPTGIQWRFNFTVGEESLYTSVRSDTVFGVSGSYGYVDGISRTIAKVDPVLDMDKNEVRITVPLSGFAERVKINKTGTKLTGLSASAGRFYNFGAVTGSEPSDRAEGPRSYSTGTKSCVAVGK